MTLDFSTCPHCGNDHLYKLADGRYKCSACSRKFSRTGRRSRLSETEMDAIVFGFVAGNSASMVAKEIGLNLKTVQFYFNRIRELLAKDREEHLTRAYGSTKLPPDFFTSSGAGDQWRNAIFMGCLVDRDAEMELLLVNEDEADDFVQLEPSMVSGWLVAADRTAFEELQLDRIFCLPGKNARERARAFWTKAKHRLSAYCGGFKKHFKLYLREVEFRNNIKNTEAARDHIGDLLDQNPNTSRGEEDA